LDFIIRIYHDARSSECKIRIFKVFGPYHLPTTILSALNLLVSWFILTSHLGTFVFGERLLKSLYPSVCRRCWTV